MSSLPDEFEKTIRQRRLLGRRQAILVAVSGGIDSMVLLHLMDELAKRYDWRLTVAHLNHRLRGKSSEADARSVKLTAKKLGWPAIIGAANVRDIARREKLSLEMAARQARHEFLARTAARLRIHSVALAHHADDQLELFFLRLFRGSGSQGLAGMKWRNPSPYDKRIELVRPLLGQTRATLSEYARQHRILFREDTSNASLDIQRNRIRHELLPLLRSHYQPALDNVITRVLDITAAEAEFVTDIALGWINQLRNVECGVQNEDGVGSKRKRMLSRSGTPFDSLPVAVQRRSLQLQLLRHGVAADFDLVEQLRLKENRSVCVSLDKRASSNPRRSKPYFVIRDATGLVRLTRVREGEFAAFPRKSVLLDMGSDRGKVNFDGVQVLWQRKRHRVSQLPIRRANCEWFDAHRVGSKITLRHWQPGDRFQPIGMPTPIKLQDFFTTQKVPRERRHELLLAISADNEVFWVEGMRISERFKLTKTTIRRLQWRWQRL